MASKFVENVATSHYIGNSLENIQAEYVKWYNKAENEGPYPKNDTRNQLKLSEIQLNFARANNLFYKKKFQEALKSYQYVQGLVFQLLYPSFKPGFITDAVVSPPVKAELFDKFLKVGSEMAVSLPPETFKSAVAYTSIKDLPADVQKYAQSFDELGVTTVADVVPNDVRIITMLGLEYAKSNDWNNAESLFKSGLEIMANPVTPEAKVATAALQMNLGAVYIQKGDLQSAKSLLAKAEQDFKEGNDKVGEAQAKLNMAALLNKLGKNDEAAALSKEAESLLNAETGSVTPGVTTLTTMPVSGTGRLSRFDSRISDILTSKISSTSLEIGTSIKPDTILELAGKQGAGVVFRLPTKGDGWVTQDLESNIEKQQKLQAKEIGFSMGNGITKLKWNESTGLNLSEIKTSYYTKRIDLKTLEAVNLKYILPTDLAINLPHMYLYQLPVCIGDCYHHLGEYAKAFNNYSGASDYQFININIELPALWIKIARNYLEWGNSHYKNDEVQKAFDVYSNVILTEDKVPVNSSLYKHTALGKYGNGVSQLILNINDPDSSPLNPDTINIVLDIRNRLKMINAGLDYFGFPANYFPIFKFDFLQSAATYFAQQAIQAEREYINFTSRGEDEQMTREQLQQSIELSKAQVDLADKQVEYAQAELNVNRENKELADLRLQNAQQQKQQYADVSYEITALEAATVFASGPEGYKVSYTYYSPSEGKNVTLSGSDAYKVMEDAAWKKGMLSREMELANMQRNINELNANQQLAQAQVQAAEVNVEVAVQQKKVAEMNRKHSQELLDSFESQIFTPEVWFQLGTRMLFISKTYLQRAIGIARKMQKAYELETGRALNTIKGDYNTNIISGLLSADYLLSDINYFTVDRINNSSKDIPLKQMFSLAELNPIGFNTTFKSTGRLEFETTLSDFDFAYPGSFLRKVKKIEVIVEGLIPPQGVHGTLKNSGISRDRKENGELFFRVQPHETLYLSNYNPRQDLVIFQPDSRVLDVFENCGIATGWTLEIPAAANDLNYETISDVKMIVYYTAQYSAALENTIRPQLPKTGEKSSVFPFRLLFPDEYFNFIDNGELKFSLYHSDFAFNETEHKVKNISVKIVMEEGTSSENLKFNISQGTLSAAASSDINGIIKSDKDDNGNPLNTFIDKELCTEWTITLSDGDNQGIDRTKVKDLFFFVEYTFKYKGM